jgi:hypothetical protein
MCDSYPTLPQSIKEDILDRARQATTREELASAVSDGLREIGINMRMLSRDTLKDLVVDAARAARRQTGLRVWSDKGEGMAV